ncbi:MAG TPA: hypothetical protein PKI61_00015 [bacterium]|nr:hypothetical protein [bacterium]HPT29436.1 hypothetical protein [bacterium]
MTHLIFEGAELSGKSFVMSQVYNFLEAKYHQGPNRLDGCYWFNCDLGFFGSDRGEKIIKSYLKILKTLAADNVILEKFHLTDIVYNFMYRRKTIRYNRTEKKLQALGYKIIFLSFPEDEELLQKRLADRLRLYPHYQRIAKEPSFYIQQQRLYRKKLQASRLPYLEIEMSSLPDQEAIDRVLRFIGEI